MSFTSDGSRCRLQRKNKQKENKSVNKIVCEYGHTLGIGAGGADRFRTMDEDTDYKIKYIGKQSKDIGGIDTLGITAGGKDGWVMMDEDNSYK